MKKLLLAATVLFPITAFGATLNVDNVALPYSETLNLTGTVDGLNVSATDLAGEILLTLNVVGSSTQFTSPVWCDDIFHDITIGSSGETYSQTAVTSDNSTNPSMLSADQISSVEALASYGDMLMEFDPTNQNASEVQMAIWSVEYNSAVNNLSFSGGTFDQSDIDALVAIADASGGSAGELVALSGQQSEIADTISFPVPEPTTIALLGFSLIALGAFRKLAVPNAIS